MHNTKAALRTTLRVAMVRQDVTVRQLAAHLGLSAAAVHRRMSGQVAWNTDELDQVADYLGVRVGEFFEEVSA